MNQKEQLKTRIKQDLPQYYMLAGKDELRELLMETLDPTLMGRDVMNTINSDSFGEGFNTTYNPNDTYEVSDFVPMRDVEFENKQLNDVMQENNQIKNELVQGLQNDIIELEKEHEETKQELVELKAENAKLKASNANIVNETLKSTYSNHAKEFYENTYYIEADLDGLTKKGNYKFNTYKIEGQQFGKKISDLGTLGGTVYISPEVYNNYKNICIELKAYTNKEVDDKLVDLSLKTR